jgi:hypothetical protein
MTYDENSPPTDSSQPSFPDIKRVRRVSHAGPDPIAVCRRIERRASRQLSQLFFTKTSELNQLR